MSLPRPARRAALAAALVLPCLLAGAPLAGGATATAKRKPAAAKAKRASVATPRFFAPSSVWNTRVPATAPLHPESGEMVTTLAETVRQEAATGRGPGFGTRSRAPIYTVKAGARLRHVRLDTGPFAADLQRALDAGVPLPAGAVPGNGDGHLVVWQPSTDTMWEFFQLQQALHAPRFAGPATVSAGGALAAGTYTYRMTAVNARGETTALINGVAATAPAGGRVTLRWTPIVGATGYRVYRSAGPAGPPRLLADVHGAANSWTDEGHLAPAATAPPAVNGAATPGAWRAAFGGRMRGVSSNPGHFVDVPGAPGADLQQRFWGATATSLPLVAGMVTRADARRGRIDHALALGLPNLTPATSLIAADRAVYPAQRADGKSTARAAIPEGTRLRLDPALDLGRLDLKPFTRMLAVAAQRYGVIVQDGSAATVFYGEDPTPYVRRGEANVWEEMIGPRKPGFLADFPWSRLQVLAPPAG